MSSRLSENSAEFSLTDLIEEMVLSLHLIFIVQLLPVTATTVTAFCNRMGALLTRLACVLSASVLHPLGLLRLRTGPRT